MIPKSSEFVLWNIFAGARFYWRIFADLPVEARHENTRNGIYNFNRPKERYASGRISIYGSAS